MFALCGRSVGQTLYNKILRVYTEHKYFKIKGLQYERIKSAERPLSKYYINL